MAATALHIVEGPDQGWCLLSPLRRQLLGALAEPHSAASLGRSLGLPRQKLNYHLRELEKAGLVEETERIAHGGCIERRLRAKATTYLVHPAPIELAPATSSPGGDRRPPDAATTVSCTPSSPARPSRDLTATADAGTSPATANPRPATTSTAHDSAVAAPGQAPAGGLLTSRQLQDRFSSAYLAAAAAQVMQDLAALRPAADAAGKRLPTLSQFSEVRFASAAERDAFVGELTASVAHLLEKYHAPHAPGGRSFKLLAGMWPVLQRPAPATAGEPPLATASAIPPSPRGRRRKRRKPAS